MFSDKDLTDEQRKQLREADDHADSVYLDGPDYYFEDQEERMGRMADRGKYVREGDNQVTDVEMTAYKLLMESHGLEVAVRTWSVTEEFKGLYIDDILDCGVEEDRAQTVTWFNYDAACDSNNLMNIIVEYDHSNNYYSVILTDRANDELARMDFEWDETFEELLNKLYPEKYPEAHHIE